MKHNENQFFKLASTVTILCCCSLALSGTWSVFHASVVNANNGDVLEQQGDAPNGFWIATATPNPVGFPGHVAINIFCQFGDEDSFVVDAEVNPLTRFGVEWKIPATGPAPYSSVQKVVTIGVAPGNRQSNLDGGGECDALKGGSTSFVASGFLGSSFYHHDEYVPVTINGNLIEDFQWQDSGFEVDPDPAETYVTGTLYIVPGASFGYHVYRGYVEAYVPCSLELDADIVSPGSVGGQVTLGDSWFVKDVSNP